MKKTLFRSLKYLAWLLTASFIVLMLFTAVLFKSDRFQNWVTGRVTAYLAEQFKVQVSIRHITYDPFFKFSLDDVLLGDQKQDTLFFVEHLRFSLVGLNVDSSMVRLRDVEVDGGYARIVNYKDGTFNMDVILDLIDSTTPPDPNALPFHLHFNKVKVTRSQFRFIDYQETFTDKGFDPYNEHFYNVDMGIEDFHIVDDSLNLQINGLSCIEKGGAAVTSLTSKAIITPRGMYFDDLDLKTPYSHVTKSYHMLYNSWDELADYNNSVVMVADLLNSKVSMRDVAFFIPDMQYDRQEFVVSGKIRGSTPNLKLNDLSVDFGKTSRFSGSISLKGLPDVRNLFMDVKADDAVTTRDDIEYLIGREMPAQLATLGKMKFRGRYTGFYNDFVAFGHFRTALGEINSDLNMKLGKFPVKDKYSGNLELIDFDMGRFTGASQYVGRTSLKASVDGQGFALKDVEASFSSTIRYVIAKGYRYQHIDVKGNLAQKIFTGRLDLDDENAKVNFNGTINLREKVPTYRFTADVSGVNLKKLNLAEIEATVSAGIHIDFAFRDVDRNEGTILLNDVKFGKGGEEYVLKEVKVVSLSDENRRRFSVRSDVFDIDLKGDFLLLDLQSSFASVMHGLMPNYFTRPAPTYRSSEEFDYRIVVSNSEVITEVFYPDLHIEDLSMKGHYAARTGNISLSGIVGRLRYRQIVFDAIAAELEIRESATGRLLLGTDEVFVNDTSLLRDFAMLADLRRNGADLHIRIADSTTMLSADVRSKLDFVPGAVRMEFDESRVQYRRTPFAVERGSALAWNDSQLVFTDVKVRQSMSTALVNGYYDLKHGIHGVTADVSAVDLNLVNVLYPRLAFQLGGLVNGTVVLKGSNQKKYLNTFLNISNFSLDRDTIGDFSMTSNYNDKQQRFLVYLKSVSGRFRNLECGGYVSMATTPAELNLNLAFDDSELALAQAFVKDHVHFFGGSMAAKCRITGTLERPIVSGVVTLDQVDLRIEYLKTRYRFATKVEFSDNLINIVPFTLFDEKNHTARVSGFVSHKGFSDLRYNLRMTQLDKFQVLNTTIKDNSVFYGIGYGSGSAGLSGTASDLRLETDITTEKGTVVYIPLSEDASSGSAGIINFVSRDTTVKAYVVKQNKLSGFEASCVIHATPDAEIQIILNAQQGDIIKGTGSGTIKMELTRQGDFFMYGGYTIEQGDYSFTAANVFAKKFTLRKGGTITWTGDPLQARMNIEGVYNVRRTSVSDIMSNTGTRSADLRLPVECLLYMKGNLLSPDIKFDINFPDLTGSPGSSAIDLQNSLRTIRNDPELMNMQVMSLMLFGKFAPINGLAQGGVSNLNSGVSNTLSDYFSSQASNLISKIIPGFDLMVDIQTATQTSQMRAIVTASKKFYDNRLELQTSYETQYANSANIVTQYNLTKDGNFKLKAYNRNSTNPITSHNVLTQGIGLYYRKEFDSFIELFKKSNPPKPIN